jgi:hypothetical protein
VPARHHEGVTRTDGVGVGKCDHEWRPKGQPDRVERAEGARGQRTEG